jgi:phage recombination protein Bet
MNQIATITPARQSLIASMASAYHMEPKAFADAVRSTCMPATASNEEFAAFLMVAKDYNLNPITREIYAFPKKGGGIQPIVGIDGWMNLINSHPQCDGLEFDDEFDDKKNLTSITCRIYRKDRNRPTMVTEYMAECKRPTEPWQKWPARMLRHKAAIQCARYAFGFAGIIDPEEAERSPEVITGQVIAPPPPSLSKPVEEAETIDHTEIVEETGEAVEAVQDGEAFDLEAFLTELGTAMATGRDEDQVIEIWDGFDVEATLTEDEAALQRAFDMRAARIVSFSTINAG